MNHRHLLPDEIDLLLDDEVGFGVAPLKAHIRDCADCRAQARRGTLRRGCAGRRPPFRSVPRVRGPGDVAGPGLRAVACAAREIPRASGFHSRAQLASRSAALATSMASLLTVGDPLDRDPDRRGRARVRGSRRSSPGPGAQRAGREVLSTVFGDQMFAIIQRTGTIGIAAALIGLATAAAGSVAGLRALAAVSSRRRA